MKISVIIATLNSAEHLPRALDSIRSQKKIEFECIVIDGGSIDGTVEVIKANSDLVNYWVSEADAGIADAFNKGVRVAKGLLVYFLGADDRLYDDYVFADVVSELPRMNRPYFIYGDLYYSYKKKKKLVSQNFTFKKFKKYNCLPHQAMFLERVFFEIYGFFDTNYAYAMDYEHISRFIQTSRPQYINRVIAEMRRYGKSSSVIQTHAEMDKVRLSRGYATKWKVMFDRQLLRAKLGVARLLKTDW